VRRRGAIALAAVPLAGLPLRAFAQSAEKIRFAGVMTDDLTPVIYAARNGLYQKAGLDVELVPASSGTATTTAVLAGTYELGKGSALGSLQAHLRGLPIKLAGNGVLWDPKKPITMLCVATDAQIKTGADLNGKTIGVTALNDIIGLSISAWADGHGGDSKTLKWVEFPQSAATAALADRRIDAYSFNEPILTAALDTGKVRVLDAAFNSIGARFVGAVYFANSDWAARHTDLIRKWLRVTYDATEYTNAHKAETAAMMAEVTKIPLATIQKIARSDQATTSDPSLLQPVIDTAAKYKYLSRAFPASEIYFKV
jgi:NitT/TauT family transport system substrate-binding protein